VGKTYPQIDESIAEFLRNQQVFFVATAPLSAEGRVNLSPKGLQSFAVLDPRTVAYLDLTGSGIETVAHLRENGRITLMFCAFQGPPKILRLQGRGEVIEPGHSAWEDLAARFPSHLGARAVIRVRVERIADSCGYAVPLMRFEGERDQLTLWAERKGPEGLGAYRAAHNGTSIDGLPGLASAGEAIPCAPARSRG
jgi:Pyridoxamine 5'-phosphate oxidase